MRHTPRRRGFLRKMIAVVGAGALVAGLAACSSESPAPAGTEGTSSSGEINGEGKTIVVFMPSTATIYQSDWAGSARAEAERLGYEIKIFENKTDQTEQDQQVQQFLATGEVPAAFIWWPSNSQAGINSSRLLSQVAPVIQTNQAVLEEGEEYITAYAGVRAFGIGETMGEMATTAREEREADGVELSSDEGNVLEFTFPAGYQSGIDRHDGFLEATSDAPFNILQSEPNITGFDSQATFETASQVIPKFLGEGIDIVLAQNLSMAAGAVTALEQNGLTPGEDVLVIAGNDAGDKTPLLDGKVYSAVIQSPVIEGKLAVQTVARYVATGEVTDEEVFLELEAEEPELTATPPAKVTYMPNPAIRVEDIDGFQFWGLTYEELGSQ
jgi:ABC-type sugar transport system substrate-binding protein